MDGRKTIAYFSMEVGVDATVPTYSGGLGVLAGDTLRAAADLGVDMVGVTLLHRKGYLRQRLDASGWQTESAVDWPVAEFLREVPCRATVRLEGRAVVLRAWRRDVAGAGGGSVPVYFLDADLPENAAGDRALTDHLYGGDLRYRLSQEAVLGLGGVRMLRALGYAPGDVDRYHMNEGHAALLGLELLREAAAAAGRDAVNWADVEAVRRACVFTTHTPVPAGHDQFPMDLVRAALGPQAFAADVDWRAIVCGDDGRFNMTLMALSLSHYVNGVAKRHAEVTRRMFARYAIDEITNGVHAATWVAPPVAALFDRHVPDWRRDNFGLRYALGIPPAELRDAHARAKAALLARVRQATGVTMAPDVLTLGFARRATAYKRADLIFQDPSRLRAIAQTAGPLQLVFAGKAHPADVEGKRMIQSIFAARDALAGHVRVAYLPDYDMELAGVMTAGADVWVNTPRPPLEASGTSGMKAALNGVPSLSVMDGWWAEGCIEGLTGWSIGADGFAAAANPGDVERADDAGQLYDKLERAVVPTFYARPDRFLDMMLHCVALNGSFFNTHRMLQQYVAKAYYR
jgi:starch phosphorylase